MKNPKITEEEIRLIKDAKAGSESAFNHIFKKYKSFVDNLLFQYIKDMDEAKDLTNIVFLKVHDKLSKFTKYDSFGGWLRILAKNTAIDYLRTIKTVQISTDDEQHQVQLQAPGGDSETLATNRMTYDYLVSLIDELPESYRAPCKLFYIQNMTVAQISKALNIPSGSVKSALYRMRKYITKKLNL